VIVNRPKVLTGRSQKGMRVGSSISVSRRRWHGDPPDYRTQPPHPLLPIGQQGKPHSSRRRRRRYSDRKGGDGGGGRGTAEQAKAAL
jgi:hypothetical protein